MYTPLVDITVPSIYPAKSPGPLPKRLARCTPDMKTAILGLIQEVDKLGGKFVLSDLFRSYDQQLQANADYVSGKKKAYSPPPGSSFHEAGRAFDISLQSLGNLGATHDPLTVFHPLAAKFKVTPIIASPDSRLSEAWHFELKGSHQIVYDYYKANKGTNVSKPAAAAAASAIVSAGLKVDFLGDDPLPAYIQSGLIRLGYDVGNMDGQIGPKTLEAIQKINIQEKDINRIALAIEHLLMKKFPDEYFIRNVEEEFH
jgi:hypothetical protein